MDKVSIPVVWGLDEKYVLQAFVVMRSILINSKEEYHFFILTADNIEDKVKEFTDILKKEYNNFEIFIRTVAIEYFANVQIYNKHLSKAAYFRLLISELIPEYDKCIYLDCDLIVYGDLKELYEIELGDDYLAGVKDCHIMENTPRQIKHQQVLGLPTREKYVNSGVLVMNLKDMRQDRLVSSFFEQLSKENWYEDQDVLNYCCYPAIKVLPLKYNLFHFYLGKNIKFLYDLPYEKREFDFDHAHPFILHMGGSYKPWNSFAFKGSKEWWEIARVFHASVSYQMYRQACRRTEEYDEIRGILDRAGKSEHVVVWGYGENGRLLCDILLGYQLENLAAIADNNEHLWWKEYRGIPVRGLQSILGEYDNILWLVTCRQSYAEITEQLQDCGINRKDIIHFINNAGKRLYFLSLDESAYDKEIVKIADMEYVCQIADRDERERYIKNIIQNPLTYAREYTYLAEKYAFRFWIQTVSPQEAENENNCYHSLPE